MRCGILCLVSLVVGASAQSVIELRQGPFVGHVTPHTARLWLRVSAPCDVELRSVGEPRFEAVRARADGDRDHCVVFDLVGLSRDTSYRYRVVVGDDVLCDGEGYVLRTARDASADGTTRLCFGSCAREDLGTAAVWKRLAREDVDVVVLLGDTPYIDTTELTVQRRRYAEFASVDAMAALLRSTSWYGTWDDHDFGANDTDGRLAGRQDSRRAFVEFHAHPSYGDGEHGIYTKFRRGPFEVFLLDTRYFAAREPSPFRQHAASLLGAAQWTWLRSALKASEAPIKILACGMIWNEATRPDKDDHWGSYPHERDALFAFLGEHEITGVVLVCGDIHRSRVVRHATKDVVGYDILELISSPMHAGVIDTANAPHPGLIKDMGEPNTFLLIEAEQKGGIVEKATARFRNARGVEHFAIDL